MLHSAHLTAPHVFAADCVRTVGIKLSLRNVSSSVAKAYSLTFIWSINAIYLRSARRYADNGVSFCASLPLAARFRAARQDFIQPTIFEHLSCGFL
jgi:hypothetical protein